MNGWDVVGQCKHSSTGACGDCINAALWKAANDEYERLLQNDATTAEREVALKIRDAVAETQGETTFREDERQACWEDFIRVVRTYSERGVPVKVMLRGMLKIGWKDLGTGDGKPLHRSEDSEVSKWLRASTSTVADGR